MPVSGTPGAFWMEYISVIFVKFSLQESSVCCAALTASVPLRNAWTFSPNASEFIIDSGMVVKRRWNTSESVSTIPDIKPSASSKAPNSNASDDGATWHGNTPCSLARGDRRLHTSAQSYTSGTHIRMYVRVRAVVAVRARAVRARVDHTC